MNVEGFGALDRKGVKHSTQSLMGHPSGSLEDSSAENNTDYGGSDHEVLEGNSISDWTRDDFCDILADF